MRRPNPQVSEFELVPSDLEPPTQKDKDSHQSYDRRKWRPAMLWNSRPAKYFFYTVPLLIAIVPVVVLLAFSAKLSHRLGSNGCTPSGDFVIPFTSSIWDTKRFFGITIAFVGPGSELCSWSATSEPGGCYGYNFTQAKIIDIAWDVLVGRGFQAVLIIVAYSIFGRVVKVLMARGEVGYDLFSAIAFESGSAMSFVTIVRHAAGWTPIPRTRRAMVLYSAMAAATFYIIIISSLIAAMTGYTSYYEPTLQMSADQAHPNGGSIECGGAIYSVWGRVENPYYAQYPKYNDPFLPILYDIDSYTADDIEYYNRYYSSVYEVCPKQLNISNCPEAQQDTYTIDARGREEKINGPMLGIVPYGDRSADSSGALYWLCQADIFKIEDDDNISLPNKDNYEGIGICQASNGYAWGFSFLLTFVTSILHLFFTIVMYMLWFEVRRAHVPTSEVGTVKDAVTLVTLAQQQYGTKIGQWSSNTLQREILAGNLGMTFADGEHTTKRRKRKASSRDEQEYGDPRAGDWGGDVYVTDSR